MVKTLWFKICLILGIVSVTFHVWAGPATYGAEFELTSKKIQASTRDILDRSQGPSEEKKHQMALVDYLRSKCVLTGCAIEDVRGKFDTDYILKFTDGFWIKYSYDPKCVEITFKPLTLKELREKASTIDEYVFNAGRKLKMFTEEGNTSHFNMGIKSAFGDQGSDFLRFFVDYANHPDLALGSLGHDIYNAPPLSILNKSQRMALKDIVTKHNSGYVFSVQEVAQLIQNNVYTHSYEPTWGGKNHYQAVGIKYVNRTNLNEKDAPMELRSVWAQKSTEDFIKVAELVEARIQYLKKMNTPIVYNETKKTDFSPSQLLTRFKIYVEETGLKFADYQSLLPYDIQIAKETPLLNRKFSAEKRLSDLINYFDLIGSSEIVQNRFAEILNLPALKDHPQAIAYRDFFDKMSDADVKKEQGILLKDAVSPTEVSKDLSPLEIYRTVDVKVKQNGNKLILCKALF